MENIFVRLQVVKFKIWMSHTFVGFRITLIFIFRRIMDACFMTEVTDDYHMLSPFSCLVPAFINWSLISLADLIAFLLIQFNALKQGKLLCLCRFFQFGFHFINEILQFCYYVNLCLCDVSLFEFDIIN